MYVVKNENSTKVQLANQNQIRCNVSILKNKEKIQVRGVKKPCGIWVAKGDEMVANANSWLP